MFSGGLPYFIAGLATIAFAYALFSGQIPEKDIRGRWLWAEQLGRTFANAIRRRSTGRLGDKWHLDEAVVSIRGKKHWLWRAVDQDGFVLEVLVQSRRNAKGSKQG